MTQRSFRAAGAPIPHGPARICSSRRPGSRTGPWSRPGSIGAAPVATSSASDRSERTAHPTNGTRNTAKFDLDRPLVPPPGWLRRLVEREPPPARGGRYRRGRSAWRGSRSPRSTRPPRSPASSKPSPPRRDAKGTTSCTRQRSGSAPSSAPATSSAAPSKTGCSPPRPNTGEVRDEAVATIQSGLDYGVAHPRESDERHAEPRRVLPPTPSSKRPRARMVSRS